MQNYELVHSSRVKFIYPSEEEMGDLTFIVAERKTAASTAPSSSRSFNVLLYLLVFQVPTLPPACLFSVSCKPARWLVWLLPLPGPDPLQSSRPGRCSPKPLPLHFWLRPDSSTPAQDLDPDRNRRVPAGRGLRQLPSAGLRQRTSVQVSHREVPPLALSWTFSIEETATFFLRTQLLIL